MNREEELNRRHEKLKKRAGFSSSPNQPQDGRNKPPSGSGSGIVKFLLFIIIIVILGGGGYFGYQHFSKSQKGPPSGQGTAHTNRSTIENNAEQMLEANGRIANRWAVIIGIDQYQQAAVGNLRYCAKDAANIKEALVNYSGFDESNIVTLLNEEATASSIRSKLGTWLARNAQEDDLVFIFYSGHGGAEADITGNSSDGAEKYLLPHDTNTEDLYGTAIPMSEIARIFQRIVAKRLLFVLDACYSGAAEGKGFSSPGMKAAGFSSAYLDQLSATEGHLVMTASKASELSYESQPLKSGIFTYHFCEALSGKADISKDGIVTTGECFEYVSKHVPQEARKLGALQHPVMKGSFTGVFPLSNPGGKQESVDINNTAQSETQESEQAKEDTELSFWIVDENTSKGLINNPTQLMANSDAEIYDVLPDGRIVLTKRGGSKSNFTFSATCISNSAGDKSASMENAEIPPLNHNMVNPTEEELAIVEQSARAVETVVANELSGKRAKAVGSSGNQLPVRAINSLSKYFPPIENQGPIGSCASWAGAYYYGTYTQARDYDVDASKGDKKDLMSPMFLYSLINGGKNQGVADMIFPMMQLNSTGSSSLALCPYDPSDYTTWPKEEAWLQASQFRTIQCQMIGNMRRGCSTKELLATKQLLANGQIAATQTLMPQNLGRYLAQGSADSGVSKGVFYKAVGPINGGHAMTLVGYDDEKPYIVDGKKKKGAFLIANSWGNHGASEIPNGRKGFAWVAYEAWMANNQCFGAAYFNEDRPNYTPRFLVKLNPHHPNRGHVSVYCTVGSSNGSNYASYDAIDFQGGLSIPIGQEGRGVVVDLTDGEMAVDKLGHYLLGCFVQVSDKSASAAKLSAKDITIYTDFDGDGSFAELHVDKTQAETSIVPGEKGGLWFRFLRTSDAAVSTLKNVEDNVEAGVIYKQMLNKFPARG